MNVNLSEIRKRALLIDEYVDDLEEPSKEKYLARKQAYQLQTDTIDELKKHACKHVILVFSASWCKDCAQQVPVLALIAEKTGMEVRVFGGIKKDPLSHTSKWRIPPSPPEVLTFAVESIPLIIILDLNGMEIGRIIESPKRFPTLEQEICEIIRRH
jgi:thiol-disulfide isomerase/thioredoxin